MQTPRGFLVGAGVIAAVAAIATIGNPRPPTSVEMASPRPEVEGTVVTPPTMPTPEMPAPSDRVDVRTGASTTTSAELSDAPAGVGLDAPSAKESTMSAVETTAPPAPEIVDTADRPSVPPEDDGAGNEQPPGAPPASSATPASTLATTVTTLPPSSPNTTLPPPSSVIVPPIEVPKITVPPMYPFLIPNVSVPQVTVPPVLPPISVPTVPALPTISIPVINPAISSVEIAPLEQLLRD